MLRGIDGAVRLERRSVKLGLSEAIATKRIVEVTGAMGAGKSVLLAALASEKRWPFLRGVASLKEAAFSALASVTPDDESSGEFDEAMDALAAWSVSHEGGIVLDSCRDLFVVTGLVEELRRRGAIVPIVFSSQRIGAGAFERFEVPRLSREEIAEYLSRRLGQAPADEQVTIVERSSGGIPLFLRLSVLDAAGTREP